MKMGNYAFNEVNGLSEAVLECEGNILNYSTDAPCLKKPFMNSLMNIAYGTFYVLDEKPTIVMENKDDKIGGKIKSEITYDGREYEICNEGAIILGHALDIPIDVNVKPLAYSPHPINKNPPFKPRVVDSLKERKYKEFRPDEIEVIIEASLLEIINGEPPDIDINMFFSRRKKHFASEIAPCKLTKELSGIREKENVSDNIYVDLKKSEIEIPRRKIYEIEKSFIKFSKGEKEIIVESDSALLFGSMTNNTEVRGRFI